MAAPDWPGARGNDPCTASDLFTLPIQPMQEELVLLVLAQTMSTEGQRQFSPDGRWIAYTSNETDLSEIYVTPFPATPIRQGQGRFSVPARMGREVRDRI